MNTTETYNEKQLLQKIATGDESAFRELFYAWHNKLGAYVLGWTKSLQTTEEIVQDVFLKLWTNRTELASVNNFENYIYIVSRNRTFNEMKKSAKERNRKKQWQQLSTTDLEISATELPEDYISIVEEAMQKLPTQQRKVFELKFRQGLKYDDIGQALSISPETARKHMQSAKDFVLNYVNTHIAVTLLILTTPLLIP